MIKSHLLTLLTPFLSKELIHVMYTYANSIDFCWVRNKRIVFASNEPTFHTLVNRDIRSESWHSDYIFDSTVPEMNRLKYGFVATSPWASLGCLLYWTFKVQWKGHLTALFGINRKRQYSTHLIPSSHILVFYYHSGATFEVITNAGGAEKCQFDVPIVIKQRLIPILNKQGNTFEINVEFRFDPKSKTVFARSAPEQRWTTLWKISDDESAYPYFSINSERFMHQDVKIQVTSF